MRRTAYWGNTVVLCSESTPVDHIDYLRQHDLDCIVTGKDHVDLRAALSELKIRYDIAKIRVDSGGTLNGILFRQGLVDEVSLLLVPTLIGGQSPRSIFVAPDLSLEDGTIPLKLLHVEEFPDGYIWRRYELDK